MLAYAQLTIVLGECRNLSLLAYFLPVIIRRDESSRSEGEVVVLDRPTGKAHGTVRDDDDGLNPRCVPTQPRYVLPSILE